MNKTSLKEEKEKEKEPEQEKKKKKKKEEPEPEPEKEKEPEAEKEKVKDDDTDISAMTHLSEYKEDGKVCLCVVISLLNSDESLCVSRSLWEISFTTPIAERSCLTLCARLSR